MLLLRQNTHLCFDAEGKFAEGGNMLLENLGWINLNMLKNAGGLAQLAS
jgi:hypothetical protein